MTDPQPPRRRHRRPSAPDASPPLQARKPRPYADLVADLVAMLAPPGPREDVLLWRSHVTVRHLLPLLTEASAVDLDGGEAVRIAALDSIAPRRSL